LQTGSSVDGGFRDVLDTKICHKENIFANGFLAGALWARLKKYYPLA